MKPRMKEALVHALTASEGAPIPTSGFGRIGRMALTALKSRSLVVKSTKHAEDGGEIDPAMLIKLISSVGQLKGIAMKMGQIMSYIDVAIPKELQEALSVLQTFAQPMPFEKVVEIIRAALGREAEPLLRQMEKSPIAAASIGQVHRAWLENQSVAVKVQYPEIETAIESDFSPAAVGTKMASLFFPNAGVDGYVVEARTRFLEECNYLHEAHCNEVFREIFEDHDVLFVPPVISRYCAANVLTTHFIEGISFDAFLEANPTKARRNLIGEALFEFYIGSLFRHCIYNCDPHPGNYLFCSDGKVAMLDHGCTRQFEPAFVAKLAFLTKAVHLDERDMLHEALLRLDIVRPDKKYNCDVIRGFLRSFYGPMLRDSVCKVDLSSAMEMKEMFKKKQQLMKFKLPGEFTFLFRIRFGLMSVLSRLGAQANWYRLEKEYVQAFESKYPILLQ